MCNADSQIFSENFFSSKGFCRIIALDLGFDWVHSEFWY